ncbi:K(+)/H(+) antiporter [Coemansia sp. RSA 552]|nr:K(+)/H(+) antiporter [Coemansia sp. RSA 552]
MDDAQSPSIISGRNPIAYSTSSPLTLFIVQLLIIVCLCRFLQVFLKRLLQPPVISEVIGGILLGPTVLSRWEAFKTNVFPAESLVNLNLVANFGLVLFLFIIGLELDPRVLKRNFRHSLGISAAGILLPFGLGIAVSYALYTILMDSEGDFVTFLLFLGVAMAITAFPVLGRILTEQNLLKTTVGSISISAAAIDDVVSWCLLALVIALTNNSSGLTALWVFLVGAGWTLFVVFVLRPVYRMYLKRTGVLRGREPTQMVLFITFMMVLVSAFFTDIIGIHAIFGGFIIGVIVPHDGGFAMKVTEKIEDVVHIFFLPIYFTLSGLKTDFTDLKDGKTWGLWFLVCFVAFFGKISGCTVAARLSKFTWRESLTIGFLMNCKGLVELIVLNIGLDAGVIDTRIFSMMVLMALVTTFATTPIVVWLYPLRHQTRLEDMYDSHSANSRTGAGSPVNLLMVLSRSQQVPAIMTLLGYLHHQPGISLSRQLTRQEDGGNALPVTHSHAHRPLNIFGLRLLEATGRESSLMQQIDSESQVLTDPAMSMFRAFARIANMAFHGALTYSDRDHFVANILNSAKDANTEITVVSAFGRGSTESVVAPGWFESMGWGFTSEQQASLVTALFDKARCHVCVFIDCGLAEDTLRPLGRGGVDTRDGAEDQQSEKEGRVGIVEPEEPRMVPGASSMFFGDGRRVPLVIVPFFGGLDDRQAVQMAAELCTHSAVQVVVWRYVKASRPTNHDVVLSEDQYPARPNIPLTPAATESHHPESPENPAVQTASTDSGISKNEVAEQEEDDIFLDTILRPREPESEGRGRRDSMASANTATTGQQPANPEAATSEPVEDQVPMEGRADNEGAGRGGIRSRITQRLNLRRQGTRTTDTGGLAGITSTQTEGVRATRFPNVHIRTTVTNTTLQTLLLDARTLAASDLVVCGRSVKDSLPYFSNAQELAAYTPAGHANTKAERQHALGTTAEYLLGFGTSASLLVVQASSDPLGQARDSHEA